MRTTEQSQTLLDDQTSMTDLFDHPFRAQYGYGAWGDGAGLLASTGLEALYTPEKEVALTPDDVKTYEVNAFPVVRKFCEFGYNSRVAETAIVTSQTVYDLLRKAIGQEELTDLRNRPAIVRASLIKLAKESFIWGRTGDLYASVKFGEKSSAEEIPQPKDIFFPEDITEFASRIGDRVAEVAMPELRKGAGPLGRLALKRKHRSRMGRKIDSLTPRRRRLSTEQWLKFIVGSAAATEASRFVDVDREALDKLESQKTRTEASSDQLTEDDGRNSRERFIGSHSTVVGIGGIAVGASSAAEFMVGQPSVGLMIMGGGVVLLATTKKWIKHGNKSIKELRADKNKA